MTDETVELLESIRERLAGDLVEGSDPDVEAANIIDQADGVIDAFQKKVNAYQKSMDRALRDLKGLRKAGAGDTEATTLLKKTFRDLKGLEDLVKYAMGEYKKAGVR